MPYPTGHLQAHPLPSGVVGALTLSGYQLLVDVAGVGAGRLGSHAFLLIAPDPEGAAAQAAPAGANLPATAPSGPSGQSGAEQAPLIHLTFHQQRLPGEGDAVAYQQLAAQLGYLRLSGYRVALERVGLRSNASLVNPATGAVALRIPAKHPGRLFGGGAGVSALLAAARALPPAGPPPDLQSPELLGQTFLALALGDDSVAAADAPAMADRALELTRADPTLDPVAALAAAKDLSR